MITLDIRHVEEADKALLFEWRNHPVVRQNSFNVVPLEWESHIKWFAQKINNPDVTMYMVCHQGQPVGTTRYEFGHAGVQISVMLNPDWIGQGLGARVIELSTHQFMKERDNKHPILAEIKCDNIASQKAFEKAGFVKTYLTYIFQAN